MRSLIAPAIKPVYAGYVGWRGLVEEAALSGTTHAAIFDAMVFALPPNEQFISYPIAGANDELTPGHRRCNFVWYRPAPEGELRLMLTDASGRLHPLGIPPPLIRPEVTAALREAARALIAPPLEEVVRLAPQPFLQPIFDVESERMASGRVALVGDAAFLGRPHVAAGVTKAAEDAAALAQALAAHRAVDDDVATALEDAVVAGKVAAAQVTQTRTVVFNERLDAVVCAAFLVLVAIVVIDSVRVWYGVLLGTLATVSSESPFIASQLEAESV